MGVAIQQPNKLGRFMRPGVHYQWVRGHWEGQPKGFLARAMVEVFTFMDPRSGRGKICSLVRTHVCIGSSGC
jgi:hypothetical protein